MEKWTPQKEAAKRTRKEKNKNKPQRPEPKSQMGDEKPGHGKDRNGTRGKFKN